MWKNKKKQIRQMELWKINVFFIIQSKKRRLKMDARYLKKDVYERKKSRVCRLMTNLLIVRINKTSELKHLSSQRKKK